MMLGIYVENHRSGNCPNPEEKIIAINSGMVLLTGLPGYGKTKLLGHLESTSQLGGVIYVDFLSLDQRDYPTPQGFVNYFQTILKDNPIMILIDHPWAYDAYMDAIDEHIIKPFIHSGGKVIVACRRREDNPFSLPSQRVELTAWTKDGVEKYFGDSKDCLDEYRQLYGDMALHVPSLVVNGLKPNVMEDYFLDLFGPDVSQGDLRFLAILTYVDYPMDIEQAENKVRQFLDAQGEIYEKLDIQKFRAILRNSEVILSKWNKSRDTLSFEWNPPLQRSLQVWLELTEEIDLDMKETGE